MSYYVGDNATQRWKKLPPVSTVYNVDEMSNTYALIKKRIDFGIASSLINAYVFDISSTLYALIKEQPLIKCEHSTSCLYNQWRSAYMTEFGLLYTGWWMEYDVLSISMSNYSIE
jgi:hypothetical protein